MVSIHDVAKVETETLYVRSRVVLRAITAPPCPSIAMP